MTATLRVNCSSLISNVAQTVRTRRHRRVTPLQPVLLAHADGAGAQGTGGGDVALALHRKERDRAARFGEGSGAAASRQAGGRFLGDRELSRRRVSGPSFAVRR